jgi:hypothetical protein
MLSALGHEFVAEADVGRGLPESLPDALQGGRGVGGPTRQVGPQPPDVRSWPQAVVAHDDT